METAAVLDKNNFGGVSGEERMGRKPIKTASTYNPLPEL